MNVALVYVHPRPNQRMYLPMARRFVRSYQDHPPGGTDHSLHVIINGDEPKKSDQRTFSPLEPHFHQHDNFGKDIGAFQKAAREIPCDLMVFMGAHVHFPKAGWLDVMANAYLRNGPGIYGAYAFHNPALHIRTTCFWMPPDMLRMYPVNVGNDQRYEFEHGRTHGIAKWVIDIGLNAWQVTWRAIYPPESWCHVENQDALVLDQHTDRIGYK